PARHQRCQLQLSTEIPGHGSTSENRSAPCLCLRHRTSIITIVAIVIIEILDSRSARPAVPEVRPSRLTPDTAFLKQLVRGALEAVCRAVSIPETPESAKLRVFIFENKENRSVCSHYWAQNPVEELVGKLEF